VSSTVTQFSSQININFPVAGEDNDSQGFRSNFSKIQNAFLSASKEITDLQVNSVSLNGTNDFGNNVIKRASLQGASELVNNAGSITTSTVTVDYALGSYQQFSVTPDTYVFTVANWPPSGKLGKIRLEITPTTTATTTISFGGAIQMLSTTTVAPLTYRQTTPIVWELFTPDNGAKILAYRLH
jgi:hypothetical protein